MGKQIASPQLYSWMGGQQDFLSMYNIYSRVFPKSVRIPGILLFLQLIWMICGCEGPGVDQVESDIPVVISWIQISKAAGTMSVQYVDSKTQHT